MTNFAILMRIVNVLKEEGFQLKLFVKLRKYRLAQMRESNAK